MSENQTGYMYEKLSLQNSGVVLLIKKQHM